jgi:voltage-gated potassium channel
MNALPIQLLTSAGMFLLTIVIHILGLMALAALGRIHITHLRTPWLGVDRMLIPTVLAFGLVLIHAAEILVYAWIFTWVGASNTFLDALYFSVGSYSTADVAELALDPQWRLIGALESLNGILLIGWSTAFLFQNLHRILNSEDAHPFPLGAIARPLSRPSRSGKGAPPGTNSSDTELMQ